MIIATMLIVRYALLEPMLHNEYRFMDVTLRLQLPLIQFVFLVFATLFLTASGYIINDYFDVNADMVNKPDKVIIGKHISRRLAMLLHWVFNILGVVLGGIVSYHIGFFNFTLIFVFIAGLLWFYSTTFSKEPFIGNILVSILVALVPLIEAVYELIPLNFMYKNILNSLYLSFEQLLFWSLGYSIFAFLVSLVREMVKDIEDLEGDSAYGRNTIPIAYGIKAAKYITTAVFGISIFALIFVNIAFIDQSASQLYIYIGILLPLAVSTFLFIKADSPKQYHLVSTLLKIVMIMGLLLLICKSFLF